VFRRWTKANLALWEEGFATLCKFRAREGHCCPLTDHVEDAFRLGLWVANQRRRKAFLPLKRERRLDAIGFVWDPRDHNWEQGFIALLNFKRREGHCCVPQLCRRKVQTWKVGFYAARKQEDNVRRADSAIEQNRIRVARRFGCWVDGAVKLQGKLLNKGTAPESGHQNDN
jgi:Helicase associated domain